MTKDELREEVQHRVRQFLNTRADDPEAYLVERDLNDFLREINGGEA